LVAPLGKTDAGEGHAILAVDSRHWGDHIEYAAPRGVAPATGGDLHAVPEPY